MTDTAQPLAAETDPVAAAADAFKVHLGQMEQPAQRDEKGRFASATPTDPEVDEVENEIEPEALDAEGEEQDPDSDDEAQPDEQPAVEMPRSWPGDKAEVWASLPPEAQEFISLREGQRDAAVNAKFQEAAVTRKQYELQAQEAAKTRETFATLADAIARDLQPVPPPSSMLDRNSRDYNPERYRQLVIDDCCYDLEKFKRNLIAGIKNAAGKNTVFGSRYWLGIHDCRHFGPAMVADALKKSYVDNVKPFCLHGRSRTVVWKYL